MKKKKKKKSKKFFQSKDALNFAVGATAIAVGAQALKHI